MSVISTDSPVCVKICPPKIQSTSLVMGSFRDLVTSCMRGLVGTASWIHMAPRSRAPGNGSTEGRQTSWVIRQGATWGVSEAYARDVCIGLLMKVE